jgi:protein-disulfide isomerase
VGVDDAERFDAELREGVHAARVAEDLESGARSGVPSTPRFFVNGLIHLGAASYPELVEVISEELELSGGSTTSARANPGAHRVGGNIRRS